MPARTAAPGTTRSNRRGALVAICLLLVAASAPALQAPAAAASSGQPPGTIYFAGPDDTTLSTLYAGAPSDPVGSGLSGPRGLAVAGDGTVYVADTGANRVVRIDTDGTSTVLADALSAPSGVAVDASGNVFVADTGNGRVVLLAAGGPQEVAAGFLQPEAVAVAPSGHLVVADAGADQVVDVAPDGTRTTLGDALSAPDGVSVAPDGTVVVADTGNDRVVAIAPDGTQETIAAGLGSPTAVSTGGDGTAYVADSGDSRIVAIAPDGTQSDVASATVVALAAFVADQTITFTSSVPSDAAVGTTYLASASGGASGQPVVFSADTASTGCTVDAAGTVTFTAVGTCVLDADQAGTVDYQAAPRAQQTIAVGRGSQTVTFTSSLPADPVVGGTYTAVATGGASGQPVVFSADAGSTGCDVAVDGTVTLVHAASCIIDADQAGDANWEPAPQAQQQFATGKGQQTITFTSGVPDGAVVGGSYMPSATGGASGQPVMFSVDPASTACSIDASGVVSFDDVGTCAVLANQDGDADWDPAAQAEQAFTIARHSGTLTFTSTPPADAVVGETYLATASEPAVFSADPTSTGCAVAADGTVEMVGAGACVIDATRAGNGEPATAQQSFVIGRAPQVITFTSTPPAAAAVGDAYVASATGGASENPVVFTADATSTGCTVATDGTVQFTAVGTCVVDADQDGTVDYNAAQRVQQTITVGRGTQTIVFTSSPPAAPVVGQAYEATATGGASGTPVKFAATAASTGICTVTGTGLVHFIAVGSCTVVASQAGTVDYFPATRVHQTMKPRFGQTITFTSAPVRPTVGGKYTPTATGGASGKPIAFSIITGSPAACELNHGTVTFLAEGTCTVVATQAGTTNYVPATTRQAFTVYVVGMQSPIKHVVLIFQENHSFDETLGAYCATRSTPCDGYVGPVWLANGARVQMTQSPDIVPVVDHTPDGQLEAVDGGAMDGWASLHGCTAPKYGCLSYYTPGDIPNLAALADRFVVADRTFSLANSPSWGGHLYAAAATLDGFTGANPEAADGVPAGPGWGCDSDKVTDWVAPHGGVKSVPSCIPAADGSGPFEASPANHVSTIFDEMDAQQMSWKIYGATPPPSGSNYTPGGYGWSICPTFADCLYTSQVNNLVPSSTVLTDAADGALPAYSVVTPSASSRAVIGADTSQHNDASMLAGDNWIGRVVSAIQNGPDWDSTAIFITYDDCGCFYDHVVPPTNPDGTPEGIRLPMVIVSPYARADYTDSNNATLASVLAFTERTLGLPALAVNDAAAYDYSQSFDFSQRPRTGPVLRQSTVPKSSIRYSAAHPEADDDAT